MFGVGGRLNTLLNEAKYAAVTDVPILLWGETGVGKEIMARHIHRLSGRQGPVHSRPPREHG